jgi:hypothetical protein
VNAVGDDKGHSDPAGVRSGLVLCVAVAMLLVMGLGTVVAWEIERSGTRHVDGQHTASRFGAPPPDMNGIEMSLLSPGTGPHGRFVHAAPPAGAGVSGSDAARERLQQYGWADREHGRVHIPIARAIELYLARESAAVKNGAPLGAGATPTSERASEAPGGKPARAPNGPSRRAP